MATQHTIGTPIRGDQYNSSHSARGKRGTARIEAEERVNTIAIGWWLIAVVCCGAGCATQTESGSGELSAALSTAGADRGAPLPAAQAQDAHARRQHCPKGQTREYGPHDMVGHCIPDATGSPCGPDSVPSACAHGYTCDLSGGIDVGHCVKAPPRCVSKQGESCGGNTPQSCECATGLFCKPFGDDPAVRDGACQPVPTGPVCNTSSDCVQPIPMCGLCLNDYSPECAESVCLDGHCKFIAACSRRVVLLDRKPAADGGASHD
jgi:hypothetical protein